jgi:hypothetical protein
VAGWQEFAASGAGGPVSGWAKFWLITAGILIACYALGTSPIAVLADLIHALTVMHNTAATRQ